MAKKRSIPKAALRSPRGFNMITKPIGPLCNIHCEYCFYLDKEQLFPSKNRASFAMSDDVLKSYVKQYIESQPQGTKEITFIWQGGEPTMLSIDFYERALAYQRKFARPGVSITNSLQTNGTLLSDSKASFFAEHDFLLGISIDGPEHLHDKYRKDRSGNGTFKQVMAGLEMIKKHNIRFNTLTVIQDDNAQYPLEVYNFLKGIGSKYLQFIPIVEPGENGNLVSSRTVPSKAWGAFLNQVYDEWMKEDIGEIFVGHFDLLLGLHAGLPSTMCVHSKTCGRALAIEHTGDIYSCDHFVSVEHYLGNIRREGMVKAVDSPQQEKFGLDKFNALPQECLSCEFQRFCYGGCPKNRFLQGQGGKLNWLCQGYKDFYRHTYHGFDAMKKALQHNKPAKDFAGFIL